MGVWFCIWKIRQNRKNRFLIRGLFQWISQHFWQAFVRAWFLQPVYDESVIFVFLQFFQTLTFAWNTPVFPRQINSWQTHLPRTSFCPVFTWILLPKNAARIAMYLIRMFEMSSSLAYCFSQSHEFVMFSVTNTLCWFFRESLLAINHKIIPWSWPVCLRRLHILLCGRICSICSCMRIGRSHPRQIQSNQDQWRCKSSRHLSVWCWYE